MSGPHDCEKEAWLLEVARRCAKSKPKSYYSEPFTPHEWVMDALREVTAKASMDSSPNSDSVK